MQVSKAASLAFATKVDDPAAHQRRRMAIAGLRSGATTTRHSPGVFIDVQDMRVIQVNKSSAGAAIIMPSEDHDPG